MVTGGGHAETQEHGGDGSGPRHGCTRVYTGAKGARNIVQDYVLRPLASQGDGKWRLACADRSPNGPEGACTPWRIGVPGPNIFVRSANRLVGPL